MELSDQTRDRITVLMTRSLGMGTGGIQRSLDEADTELLGTLAALGDQYAAFLAELDAAYAAEAAGAKDVALPPRPSPSFRERLTDAFSEFGFRREAAERQDPDAIAVDE